MSAITEALERWRQRGGRLPFFIGIGGGSASGKSTLAQVLAERLQPLTVQVINQDRFFKEREDMPTYYSEIYGDSRPDYNRPDSFRVEEMFAFCRQVQGRGVAVLEGILALYYEELRQLMDLKIYMEADADERIVRRIRRNLKSLDEYDAITHYYLESVRYQHRRYNEPTRLYADLLVPGGMAERAPRAAMVEELCTALQEALGAG